MKIDDILTLTKAGWSKDEIMSVIHDDPQPEQPVDPQPEKPVDPQPEAQPEAQPEQTSLDERMKKIETSLDYVINRFNYMAVQQSEQPAQQTETVDDILASVVRGVKPDK